MKTKALTFVKTAPLIAAMCVPLGARADISDPDADKKEGSEPITKHFKFEIGPNGIQFDNGNGPGVLYAKDSGKTEKRPWLGVATDDLNPAIAAQLGLEDGGVTVTTVVPDSPAEKAGLKQYDIILSLDGVAVDSPDTLREYIRGKEKDEKLKISLMRKAEKIEVEATLADKEVKVARPRLQMPEPRPMPHRRMNPRDFFKNDLFADDFFKGFGTLDSWADIEDQIRSIQEQMEARFDEVWDTNQWPQQGNGAASNFMRSENAMMSFSDGEETVNIRRENGKTTVQIIGKDGKPTFEGPANTEAERAKLPERVREKVEEFENSKMDFGGFDKFQFDFDLNPWQRRMDPDGAPKLQDKVKRKSEVEKEESEKKDKPKSKPKPKVEKKDRVAA